ncbi:MAG: nitrate reductase subunit beta [Firmicutes bacterium]|nr:nitrate reductase subunit beta [Alicyclobacillaceae bacterium]MCL6496742.1 nitrate reductase subunit beta [Bacillota bacterium]
MRIKAQIAMVMNLDKCIGCHTCSVTCKNTWTNRRGAEYMWFNNVETRPGPGYPVRWEDQERWRGGWHRVGNRLTLLAGGAWKKLATIFHNPDLPVIDDYYEPWDYDYEALVDPRRRAHQPVARPRSALTGAPLDKPHWGPNWDDDLAGGPPVAQQDPNLSEMGERIVWEYHHTFLFYLPRICEHCLNPACVAACPSGAIYKRDEDGIVLVDQEACRGWRFCISACPYKKVYFNWQTHKAEKCTFCYPRIESGLPTVCSETCVGRIRYLGPILYDADQVLEAASSPDPQDLYGQQLGLFLDPTDPQVIDQARAAGISDAWLLAAQRSPVYDLAVRWQVALPLHPEYRTLPMVWYIPPLSPVLHHWPGAVDEATFPAIEALRIPLEYLAALFTAGDVKPVHRALERLWAMRTWMRAELVPGEEPSAAQAVERAGLTPEAVRAMAHLLGVAKYAERFVIPPADRNRIQDLSAEQGLIGLEALGGEVRP